MRGQAQQCMRWHLLPALLHGARSATLQPAAYQPTRSTACLPHPRPLGPHQAVQPFDARLPGLREALDDAQATEGGGTQQGRCQGQQEGAQPHFAVQAGEMHLALEVLQQTG